MKTVVVVFIIIFFTSCMKDWSLDLNTNYLGGGYVGPGQTQPNANNKMKAEVLNNGVYYVLSVKGADFSRQNWPTGDSSIIRLAGSSDKMSIEIYLIDILNTGTYKFGHVAGQRKSININCKTDQYSGIVYRNNYDVFSDTLQLDSLTATRIKGTFNVTCWNGTDSVNVNNGTFVGDL